jgi:PAS domain S-box-containing protein
MVLATVIVGLFLWALLDYIQSNKLRKIFYVQLIEKLTERAMVDRINFDRNINFYHKLAKLSITQNNLSDYIEKQNWSTVPAGRDQIKYYRQSPTWFPKPSVLRVFIHPNYAMLLDSGGIVREVYMSRHNLPPPPSLLRPDTLTLIKSHKQSFITSLDNSLYLIASESYLDTKGKLLATLMLASPINEELLISSVGVLTPGHLVALVTSEKEPLILTSTNLVELPEGMPLHILKDRYLITGQHTYDYGSAEYTIRLVSFISMSEVDKLTESVISTGRQQRNIIAPVFILIFAFIMLWVTQRINRLNKRMSVFSQQTLGVRKEELHKGDQLLILEQRFQRLTEEVIEARETLQKQAEEKTRLIVNNAFDAIIAMNADSLITTWNPQAEKIFGWTREQAVGQRAFETIISPGYRGSLEKGLKNFLDTGGIPIFNRQIQITALHRDGHKFPIEMAISPARSGDNYIFITIIRDISERKKTEEELMRHRINLRELVKERTAELIKANEQLQKEITKHKEAEGRKAQLLKEVESANQELKDFAYIVSHDLKAPLRAISSLANWLSVDYTDKLDEDGKEQLNLLIKRAGRMNALINGILEYSRLGRIKEEKIKLDMNEIVTEVIEILAPPENIKITVENELPSILFERTRITEVFQNLLSNAVK